MLLYIKLAKKTLVVSRSLFSIEKCISGGNPKEIAFPLIEINIFWMGKGE
jgi:hypothetical protein